MMFCWQRDSSVSFLYRLSIFLSWIWFALCYQYRVHGLEHFRKGGALIAVNHASYLDPPAAAIACPEEIHLLAKSSLFDSLIGSTIRKLNTHPVSPKAGNLKAIKTMVSLIKEGKKVLLFPEGTRSEDGQLGDIQPGVALLLAKTQTTIIPMYISGTFAIWNRYKKFPKPWGKIQCVFGSPICWSQYASMERNQAQRQIMEDMKIKFISLQDWLDKGARGSPP